MGMDIVGSCKDIQFRHFGSKTKFIKIVCCWVGKWLDVASTNFKYPKWRNIGQNSFRFLCQEIFTQAFCFKVTTVRAESVSNWSCGGVKLTWLCFYCKHVRNFFKRQLSGTSVFELMTRWMETTRLLLHTRNVRPHTNTAPHRINDILVARLGLHRDLSSSLLIFPHLFRLILSWVNRNILLCDLIPKRSC